jgi:hypothetical protein
MTVAQVTNDLDMMMKNGWMIGLAEILIGNIELGIKVISDSLIYMIKAHGDNTVVLDIDSPTVSYGQCIAGSFKDALVALINASRAGTDLQVYFWDRWPCTAAMMSFWELDNVLRGGGSVGDVDAMNSARDVFVARFGMVSKACDVSDVAGFVNFLKAFRNFEDWEVCELGLFESLQGEDALLHCFSKFYGALAKLAYKERERRGLTSAASNGAKKASSAMRLGSKVSAVERSEVNGDVVNVEGEELAMMKEVIEHLTSVKLGLLSELREKAVAIDEGVTVLFKWSL